MHVSSSASEKGKGKGKGKGKVHLRREEHQLGATEFFIALIIRSTCFGHFYAHHQEVETICVLLQGSRLCVRN